MLLSFETGPEALTEYLKSRGFINEDEFVLGLEKPGEGNMNFVARVHTQRRGIIIKQANQFVQKYPQIAAPQERIFVEAEFYKTVIRHNNLSAAMPMFIGLDAGNHVLVLEDLGGSTDYTFLYKKGASLAPSELQPLIHFLNELHAIPTGQLTAYPKNLALRRLNHEHLFNYPFIENNGLDLNQIESGLQEVAMTYKTDQVFLKKVSALGEIYLSQGTTLLHGDYYPGSWLKTAHGLKIIDPEFSYVGNKEFDLGVFLAHLKMIEAGDAQLDWVTSNYHAGRHFNWNLCYQFAGIEIMRRIIGLAQLPFDLTLGEKEKLLKEAYTYILEA